MNQDRVDRPTKASSRAQIFGPLGEEPARSSRPSPVFLALPIALGVLLLAILCAVSPQTASSPLHSPCRAELPATAYGSLGVEAFAAPDDASICRGESMTLCIGIYTGTVRSTFTLINPRGVSGFRDIHLANFDQRLVGRSPTTLDIEVISRLWLDSRAAYPVDRNTLPGEILPFLRPEAGWIQSADPAIVAQAQSLVAGARLQAEAVDAIQAWVRGNIAYDYTFSLPVDALSVYRNRSGVCAGFSNLTTALLRAAGIPARYHLGCVSKWGWIVGEGGGWHAWVEIYYPDAGWVAVDPQTTANYQDTSHILYGFDQCGEAGTVITRTSHLDGAELVDRLRTEYTNAPWRLLDSASIPAWPRRSLSVSPSSLSVMVPVAEPLRTRALWIENLHCNWEGWQVRTNASWLAPVVVTGTVDGPAWLTVSTTGMEVGHYVSPVTVLGKSYGGWWSGVPSQTVTVDLWVVERVYEAYLPLVGR
jgi:hypothetical protein